MKNKTDNLVNLIIQVTQEQLIWNYPRQEVRSWFTSDKHKKEDPKKTFYTFKLMCGDKFSKKILDKDDEENEEEQEEHTHIQQDWVNKNLW